MVGSDDLARPFRVTITQVTSCQEPETPAINSHQESQDSSPFITEKQQQAWLDNTSQLSQMQPVSSLNNSQPRTKVRGKEPASRNRLNTPLGSLCTKHTTTTRVTRQKPTSLNNELRLKHQTRSVQTSPKSDHRPK